MTAFLEHIITEAVYGQESFRTLTVYGQESFRTLTVYGQESFRTLLCTIKRSLISKLSFLFAEVLKLHWLHGKHPGLTQPLIPTQARVLSNRIPRPTDG